MKNEHSASSPKNYGFACKKFPRPVPDTVNPITMNTPTDYTLFGHAVTRRMFYWSIFLCPGLALMIYLSTRSRVDGNLKLET